MSDNAPMRLTPAQVKKQRINYIIKYIVNKFGLGNDIFSRGMLKTFQMQVDMLPDSDINEIYDIVKRTVNQ